MKEWGNITSLASRPSPGQMNRGVWSSLTHSTRTVPTFFVRKCSIESIFKMLYVSGAVGKEMSA